MTASIIGFGHQPFGDTAFGSSDWAEEVLWKVIPEFYKILDANNDISLVEIPLRGFIDAIKPPFNELRLRLEIFPTLWDSQKCPLPQLPALAYNVGLNLSTIQTLKLTELLNGPLGGFQLNEKVIGGLTGTRGIVGSVSEVTSSINVDTITGLGFKNGEVLTGLTSGASATINGITSDGKSEKLLRSQVLNAPQLWVNKGTDKGYQITAAFEGLLVDVTPLWAETCASDPNHELLTLEEPQRGTFITFYDQNTADKITLDKFFVDPIDAWPRQVESAIQRPDLPPGRCRSFSLRLSFRSPNDTEIEDFESVSARVLNNLERFRPIHVRFDSVTFDGPRGPSQLWRTPIVAESEASGSFNSDISGDLRSSSQEWSLNNFNANN